MIVMKRSASKEVLAPKVGRPVSFDRDEALKKAMLTFWQSGYESTSVSTLTAAMGISAPSLYATFGDKKKLFIESLQLYVGDLESVKASIRNASSAKEAAREMLVASAHAFTGDCTPKGCLLASSTAAGSEESRDVQKVVADIRKTIEEALKNRIDRDRHNGILDKETPSGALASHTIAVIQGMSTLARDGASRSKLIKLAEIAMRSWE
jgi:AcrR family transcriptional regulator